MSDDDMSRRKVLTGATAVAVLTLMPAMNVASLTPAFIVKNERWMEALETFRAATAAKIAARPRIGEDMLASENPILSYFYSPEVKARAGARIGARGAALDVFFSPASNEAEYALQRQVRAIFYSELGGDRGLSPSWPEEGRRLERPVAMQPASPSGNERG